MALILGVEQGEILYFNDIKVQVIAISEKKDHIHININGNDFLLNDRGFKEVLPEIFACVGKSRKDEYVNGTTTLTVTEALARLAIDAPRNVKILRKSKYDRQYDRNVSKAY